MLIDLQTLDVVVSQGDADGGVDGQQSDPGLGLDGPAKAAACDHESTGVGSDDEEEDEVAADAVEEDEPVPDGRYEL